MNLDSLKESSVLTQFFYVSKSLPGLKNIKRNAHVLVVTHDYLLP
jgi:hypothetical protein